MGEEAPSRDGLMAELRDLAPSAKLVFTILQHEGELTQRGIADETRLPARTVREAVQRLEAHGIITSHISFVDARQSVYALDPAFQPNNPGQHP